MYISTKYVYIQYIWWCVVVDDYNDVVVTVKVDHVWGFKLHDCSEIQVTLKQFQEVSFIKINITEIKLANNWTSHFD